MIRAGPAGQPSHRNHRCDACPAFISFAVAVAEMTKAGNRSESRAPKARSAKVHQDDQAKKRRQGLRAGSNDVLTSGQIGPPIPPSAVPYMRMFDAAYWIATKGGSLPIVLDDEKVWKAAFDPLLMRIASEEVAVIGRLGGKGFPEPIPGHVFASLRISYPYVSGDVMFGEQAYIESYGRVDDEQWEKGFDDRIWEKGFDGKNWSLRVPAWSHLQVKAADVARLWPFGDGQANSTAIDPSSIGGGAWGNEAEMTAAASTPAKACCEDSPAATQKPPSVRFSEQPPVSSGPAVPSCPVAPAENPPGLTRQGANSANVASSSDIDPVAESVPHPKAQQGSEFNGLDAWLLPDEYPKNRVQAVIWRALNKRFGRRGRVPCGMPNKALTDIVNNNLADGDAQVSEESVRQFRGAAMEAAKSIVP